MPDLAKRGKEAIAPHYKGEGSHTSASTEKHRKGLAFTQSRHGGSREVGGKSQMSQSVREWLDVVQRRLPHHDPLRAKNSGVPERRSRLRTSTHAQIQGERRVRAMKKGNRQSGRAKSDGASTRPNLSDQFTVSQKMEGWGPKRPGT